jgi:hypothetical protein
MTSPKTAAQDENGIYLRLSIQRALRGNIPPILRAVSVEYQGNNIMCRFIYDGTPSEDEQEMLCCAATEVIADYVEPHGIEEEHIEVQYPEKMLHLKYLAYLRFEP